MKYFLGIFALIVVLFFLTFELNHHLYKGREMCMAGKLYAPCDSWMMKHQPFKIHMGKQR